ncbi:YHC1 U1 small nuclear ribonucleoprotein C [Candida maltosa Xu316]|uniref:Matrin-type domain-containing protein n=1 Tax=Candida maltosa (strain Xu316) TaxID=1245528 RepID=M3K7A3_CANMX|nr:hypothetical protein G210_1333 [Candida maltosa Xu316]
MPKYYCDYCKSYLTHDTLSVRKSHLQGRNHIKLYCDYYELKAKETKIWNPSSLPYEITLDKINDYETSNVNSEVTKKTNNDDGMDIDSEVNKKSLNEMVNEDDDEVFLPPPPNLPGLPLPPPAVFNNSRQYQKAILIHTRSNS